MSTYLRTPDAIKSEVQNRYGQVADENLQVAAAGSCCGPSSGAGSSGDSCCSPSDSSSCGSPLYLGEDLTELPEAAVASSRGCGNPQTIAGLKAGEVVLDLGSGGGLDVLLAARQVGPTGFVYGVDMTDKMLELARANAAKIGATNVEFRKGELENLPLPDNSVDVIISNCVVNLSPEKENALSEAYRVLKPGGRLAISDIVVDGDLSGFPVSEAQIRAGLSWAGCIAGALTIDQFTGLLESAGFGEIDIEIQHRYNLDDFLGELPTELSSLEPTVVQELVGRFTSSAVRAQK
ncbi:MAG: arsenite methyltransferase [Caldilineaceae bacterium]|nr:arsenite methyltransferase [Caldilineaceae bacterium]